MPRMQARQVVPVAVMRNMATLLEGPGVAQVQLMMVVTAALEVTPRHALRPEEIAVAVERVTCPLRELMGHPQ